MLDKLLLLVEVDGISFVQFFVRRVKFSFEIDASPQLPAVEGGGSAFLVQTGLRRNFVLHWRSGRSDGHDAAVGHRGLKTRVSFFGSGFGFERTPAQVHLVQVAAPLARTHARRLTSFHHPAKPFFVEFRQLGRTACLRLSLVTRKTRLRLDLEEAFRTEIIYLCWPSFS